MIALMESDDEPDVGSVVLDGMGVAHQARLLDGSVLWYECGMRHGVSWPTLWTIGPLALVAITLGGNTAEVWPPLTEDPYDPFDLV